MNSNIAIKITFTQPSNINVDIHNFDTQVNCTIINPINMERLGYDFFLVTSDYGVSPYKGIVVFSRTNTVEILPGHSYIFSSDITKEYALYVDVQKYTATCMIECAEGGIAISNKIIFSPEITLPSYKEIPPIQQHKFSLGYKFINNPAQSIIDDTQEAIQNLKSILKKHPDFEGDSNHYYNTWICNKNDVNSFFVYNNYITKILPEKVFN